MVDRIGFGTSPRPLPLGFNVLEAPVLMAEVAAELLDAFVGQGLPGMGSVPGGCFGPQGNLPTPAGDFDTLRAQQAIRQQMLAAQLGAQGAGLGGGRLSGCGALDGFSQQGGMGVRDAAAVLQNNWDKVASGKFGTVDKDSLQKVVASNDASPELKLACNTLLQNPAALDVIAGAHKDCGLIGPHQVTKGDLNTVLSPGDTTLNGVDAMSPEGQLPGSIGESAAVLRKHWDDVGHGKFKSASKEDLRNILSSDGAAPELKAACNNILNTPGAFEQLCGAHTEDGPFAPHDQISQGDLNTALSPGWRG